MVSIAITFLAFGIITMLLFLSLQHKINIPSLHFFVFGSYVDKDIKCPDMSGQYEITLINYDKTKPESVKLRDEVVNKVNSFGIEIDYVLENIGVITIKSSDEQLINKLKDDFGNQIKIEPSICQTIQDP
jgi:hypothetical protein